MTYFAITQQCAEWLLGQESIRELLHNILKDARELEPLRRADFAEGPIRMGTSADGLLVTLWNVDYLSSSGAEPWGIIRIAEPNGIFKDAAISREVFERCLYVINQRLQALLIDSAFIHRTYNGGTHTCLAGRGNDARHLSIGFKELTFGTGHATIRSILCVGPLWSFDELVTVADAEAKNLLPLSIAADELTQSGRKRPALDDHYFGALRAKLIPVWRREPTGFESIETQIDAPTQPNIYRTAHWTYEQWTDRESPLSKVQRSILESDALESHPIRIIGPGGAGKTLLMLLITMRLLMKARNDERALKILYVVHDSSMALKIRERFVILGAEQFLEGTGLQRLEVLTLLSLARSYLELENQIVIDSDAEKTKEFQLETIKSALDETIAEEHELIRGGESALLRQVVADGSFRNAFAKLVMTEISVAIKAHELHEDRKRYVESERPLSRLHGILNQKERDFVYRVFERYHRNVFDEWQVLDTDDVAISLIAKLRTPISQLRRRSDGFDYVIVDETQLFNENERRVFPLLTRGTRHHVPIALALDEAQQPYGYASAGLGALGIDKIENETLPNSHRSTKEIIDLAFYVLQQTTDLFSTDFPDYTAIGRSMVPSTHPLAARPVILESGADPGSNIGKFVARRVSEMRRANIRQIAVICHADSYWALLEGEMKKNTGLPLHVIRQRGENLSPDQPIVVLSRPNYVGGQEFDAVILVGLEQGVAPPLIRESPALTAALEQQLLREMYLSITRARYRIVVAIGPNASRNSTLVSAASANLIEWERKGLS